MFSVIGLTVAILALTSLYMMLHGFEAVARQKMQVTHRGRTVFGPLAQLCDIWVIAPLPLSLVAAGEIAHLVRLRPPAAPARKIVFNLFFSEQKFAELDDQSKNETRDAVKDCFFSWVCELAIFGVPFDLAVLIILGRCGVLPVRRRSHRHHREFKHHIDW
jgi:hypothetical protein